MSKLTKIDIKLRLMLYIFHKADMAQLVFLKEILTAHERITKSSNYFKYKNKTYPSFYYLPATIIKSLPTSLHSKMEMYLAEEMQLQRERLYIDTYITTVLNAVRHVQHTVHIFPSNLHPFFKQINLEISTSIPENINNLTQKINSKHPHALLCIKKRLLKNILM